MKRLSIFCLILLIGLNAIAIENLSKSKINPELLTNHWSASWIASPHDSGLNYGVYHFRKSIKLSEIPKEFIIHVSADNRYRLFINGQPVCFGPSRGDLMHWKFESIDVSSFMKSGENVFAAVVWNFADLKPWAQHSFRTAFILQGNTKQEEIVNTNSSWKVIKNEAYVPAQIKRTELAGQFIVTGPTDDVDGTRYPWNWEKLDFADENWSKAKALDTGRPKETGTGIDWGLEPRTIPLMEAYPQRFAKIRKTENISVDEAFISGSKSLFIPANKKVTILFDQGELTTAYPELLVSGGNGAEIELKYSEALFDDKGLKGNRDLTEGKKMKGYADYFLPDGGEQRLFRPLWFRTWRYLQLTVITKDKPITINDFRSEFTGYPFKENASFKSDDAQLSEIWNVGWHTARLCAGETYYDCPYYEQLQYVGDTRIQALISLYISGDDRLMRKAIQVFDNSRFSEGLTMSRYPSSTPQVIPTYSLFWVNMVHDYWMHRKDDKFVGSFLNGIDNVLNFFISKIEKESGLVGYTGYWNFVDWAVEWPWNSIQQMGGVPKGGFKGESSIVSFQLVYSARHAADLNRWAGNLAKAEYYENIADNLVASIQKECWDNSRKYFAETPEKKEFSMHAQILAVLTDAIPEVDLKEFVLRFEKDSKLIQPTMYFRFYLTQALKKADLSDKYLETLDLWREMLDLGLTTFAEKPDPTRSDCHAWSASPNYDFLATIAGIEPAEPGFASVKMKPSLGELNEISGKVQHPKGTISFQLKRYGKGIKGEVELPENLKGIFYWQGKEIPLFGKTRIDF